jgi:ATP phosphoribosyltransferase
MQQKLSVKQTHADKVSFFRHSIQQAAGLEVVAEISETQSVLISNPHAAYQNIVDLLKLRIEGYITATKYSMIVYNVTNDLLEAALGITPGKRSPTITALDDGVSKSVSSLILKKEVSAKMDALHQVGATDILVMEISNSRM